MKKREPTEKQLAALERGRKKAARLRKKNKLKPRKYVKHVKKTDE